MQTLRTLHTRHSSTHSDKYEVSHRYSHFFWWWAHGRPKHVENRNKHTKKNCAPSWLYLQGYTEMHGQKNIKYRVRINYRRIFQNHIFPNTKQKYMMLLPFWKRDVCSFMVTLNAFDVRSAHVTRQMSRRYSHFRQTLSNMSCVTFPIAVLCPLAILVVFFGSGGT